MSDPLSLAEGKELVRLCETGRLYEVESWIRSGKLLAVPKEVRKTPLAVAMSSGFHSLVELLLRHEPSQEAKNGALRQALMFDRFALAELALAYGADVRSVPFVDVLTTGNRALVSTFLDKGADPITDAPFAHAIRQLRAKTTIGSYLDCRRSRPDLAAPLQEQLDMALRQFCQDGNLKWVSLLMWAGADPRSRGPVLDDADRADDPAFVTSGLEEACYSGKVNIVERLKPTGDDDLTVMLDWAARRGDPDLIAYLLRLGANPVARPDGGSGTVEACLRCVGWAYVSKPRPGYALPDTPHHPVAPEAQSAIRLLLKHGAVWKPDPNAVPATRRILYRLEPDLAAVLIRMLLNGQNGEAAVRDLLKIPRLRQHISRCDQALAQFGLSERHVKRLTERARAQAIRPPEPWMLRFDRQKLYEEVWSEPTETVAVRYGVSGAAIAKVCRCLRIPKPPRGYWAQKAAGQRTARPKLPPFEGKSARRSQGR